MLESIAKNGKFVYANYALGLMRESMPEQAAEIVKLRLADELNGTISDPQARDRVYLLAEHALQLGIPDLHPILAEPVKKQRDGSLVAFLQEFMAQLELLHNSDTKTLEIWHSHAKGDHPRFRMVAMRELIKMDSEAALGPVAEVLFDLSPRDAAELLVRLAKSNSAAAKSIVASVLSDERSIDYRRKPAVDAAAYAARKLNDPELLDTLQQLALSDEGSNAAVVIQLMLADSERGLAAFEAVRLPRLTRIGAPRGVEQRELEWVARLARQGRSLARWDVHPSKMRQLFTP